MIIDGLARSGHNQAMGTVEDIRQIFQDFVAPELRAITARLDALDQRFEALHKEIDLRFEAQNSRLEAALARHDTKVAAFEGKVDTRFTALDGKVQHIIDLMDVDKRLQKLEAQRAEQSAA